jgi:hydrogenase expression/formation protein HypE
VQFSHRTEITVGHGGGGRLTQDLLDRVFRPAAFANPALDSQHDGAVFLPPAGCRLAFTTDSHVVSPLFFPGGDIGQLAVNGTVNDLCMCGARPRWLSAGFIFEEGLPIATFERVVASMRAAAQAAGASIVMGDTKVVERGKGDGLYVTTSGVGVIETPLTVAPSSIRAGDAVILSEDIGRHGIAIMATRASLSFESEIQSDCAPLVTPVHVLLDADLGIHCLRDLTRGGLATALVELAETAGVAIEMDSAQVPVSELVQGACEILGLDPMYVANEGRFVCVLPEAQAERAMSILQRTRPGRSPGGHRPRHGRSGRTGDAAECDRFRADRGPPERRTAAADLLGRGGRRLAGRQQETGGGSQGKQDETLQGPALGSDDSTGVIRGGDRPPGSGPGQGRARQSEPHAAGKGEDRQPQLEEEGGEQDEGERLARARPAQPARRNARRPQFIHRSACPARPARRLPAAGHTPAGPD